MGEYRESLRTGGELVVNKNNWRIEYYFPGPDLRYNGTFLTIQGKDVDKYISAWRNNFNYYQSLKKTITLKGTFETNGEAGMTIRVGGWHDGVSISGYHMHINKQETIDHIVEDYYSAKQTAQRVQTLLRAL